MFGGKETTPHNWTDREWWVVMMEPLRSVVGGWVGGTRSDRFLGLCDWRYFSTLSFSTHPPSHAGVQKSFFPLCTIRSAGTQTDNRPRAVQNASKRRVVPVHRCYGYIER